MRVLLFGATGMVGQAALRACLQAPDVREVVAVGRTPTGQLHAKLREVQHDDLWHPEALADPLRGFDACFFCIGRTSAGMDEAQYTHFTHDMTLAVARMLAPGNPAMTFVYVSGAGADSSEQGRVMWARVRGRTENALRQLPFKAVHAIRPGVIRPLHGIVSRTGSYRWFYRLAAPLLPLLRRLLPDSVLDTDVVGAALLTLARGGWPTPVLESRDIAAAAR
ncbi:NAD(P)H-binding protein [Dyella sp.]|uniref:NAD(P)H-binding protein n=1 Tax=Dyella sp. TaxID=1869338 RepID=UPI002D7865D3|nr:NAD(P)H-binding protein [Dyella sp.]HET6432766.1 NAD(P)H-binding protein [Dyella sp.]